MPATSASTASSRLLMLLSLLQARTDWPGAVLRERLDVSERTLRRDMDRLREIGYPIRALKGPDGGYRMESGAVLPPLLFDDDQAVAIAIALQTAVSTGAGIEESAARALTALRQVLPDRLRARIDGFDVTALARTGRSGTQADPGVLLAVGAAIRNREELRFDYEVAGTREAEEEGGRPGPPRQVQPHHLVARAGRWYLVGWVPARSDWRVYRADRMVLRTPNGPRFTPREIPGGDVAAYLGAQFKGSRTGAWPCQAEVVLASPATEVAPFLGDDAVVQVVDDGHCRVRTGSWSWAALAAGLARFDTEVRVVHPPALQQAFKDLSARAARAGRSERG